MRPGSRIRREPFLYKVPFGRFGRLPSQSEVEEIPLGRRARARNGIARTPDGDALLVIQSATGLLFRVDPATGDATQVDLGGTLLVNGDGLLLSGRTLFVVQNRLNRVAVVELNSAGTSGEVTQFLTDPRFDVPTTVAAFGNRLYLPNARFGTPNPRDGHIQRCGHPEALGESMYERGSARHLPSRAS